MTRARLLDLGVRPYREVWDLQHALARGRARGARARHVDRRRAYAGRYARAPSQSERTCCSRADELARARDRRGRGRTRRRRDLSRARATGRLSDSPARALPRSRAARALARRRGDRGMRALRRRSANAGASTPASGSGAIRSAPSAWRCGAWFRCTASRFNVSTRPRLRPRSSIPCGLTDRGITSLSKESAVATSSVDEAKNVLLEELARTFDVTFAPDEAGERNVAIEIDLIDRLRAFASRVAARFAADRRRVRARQGQGQRAGAPHRLQGSRLPEPGRVLGRRNRDDHDSRATSARAAAASATSRPAIRAAKSTGSSRCASPMRCAISAGSISC